MIDCVGLWGTMSYERRNPVKRLIFAAVAVAILYPMTGTCGDHMMGVGFQTSATSALSPDRLTDFTDMGLHFRALCGYRRHLILTTTL